MTGKDTKTKTRWFCTRCKAERDIGDRWCPECGNTVYRPVYGELQREERT